MSKIPFMDYESFQFALIAGPFFTAVNATAGVLLSFIGDVRPVRVSLLLYHLRIMYNTLVL